MQVIEIDGEIAWVVGHRAAYRLRRTADTDAPAIAYGFRALRDSAQKKSVMNQSQAQMSQAEAAQSTAPVAETESDAPPEEESSYTQVDESYFSDALFIGDARVEALEKNPKHSC